MTTAPRGPAAAAAVALAAVVGLGACSSGGPSTGAATSSAPAPSSAASSPSSADRSQQVAQQRRKAAEQRRKAAEQRRKAAEQRRQAVRQRKKEAARHRKEAARHRQQIKARKRLIAACLDDTDTLHSAVNTYNAAVASGSGDRLSAAATTLRKAANKVDHNAERAKNHRLSSLSKKVVHDLGVMAALIDQGEDVSGAQLTADSKKLRSYCLSKR